MPRFVLRGLHALVACLLAGAGPALAQAGLSTEITVVTSVPVDGLSNPVVAPGIDGFVVAWDRTPLGFDAEVRARRVTTFGQLLGGVISVNSHTTGAQQRPAVTTYSLGKFIVVWESAGQDGDGSGVYGQRFDVDGTPEGGELLVSAYTAGSQGRPRVSTSGGSDNQAVVWDDDGRDGSGSGVFGQRLQNGAFAGAAFRANTGTGGFQGEADVVQDPGGPNFVVVWKGTGLGEDGFGILAKVVGNTGPLSSDFRVNTSTTGNQANPAIAANVARFTVVWQGPSAAAGLDVFAQQFTEDGDAIGGQFRVNTSTTGDQQNARVAMNASGTDFMIVWEGDAGDSGVDVFAQRLDLDGAQEGPEFRVNAFTTGVQHTPDVAALGGRNYVVVWDSEDQDAILARVFCLQLAGNANGDSAITVSDVLYLINHLFAGGPAPVQPSDVNGDHTLNVSDILFLINYLFAGGPAPGCAP